VQHRTERFGKDLLYTEKKSVVFRRFLIKLFLSVGIGVIFSYSVSNCFLYPIRLNVSFMEPTHLKGSLLFATPIFRKKNFQENSIVLFKNPFNQTVAIGRVIAVGGNTVRIHKKKVYKNEALLDEKYTVFSDKRVPLSTNFSRRDSIETVTVQQGFYFILGDNRDEALDSRDFGIIGSDQILGEVLF
jgi:signal peptidase I